MNSAYLADAIRRLELVADKHECVLKADIGAPCSDDELRQLADFLNGDVPPSLQNCLRRHNGYSLTMHDRRGYDPSRHSSAYQKLVVYSSTDIVRMTLNLRTYLDFELDADIARSTRCFEFASVDGPLDRIVFSQNHAAIGGEYPIFSVGIDEREWISEIRDPQSHAIAMSVDEFVDRSIACMLENEATFAYWDRSNTAVWPER